MISWLFTVLGSSYDWRRKAEEEYLSKATDLVDLERRQRMLMNGKVSF